MLHVVRSPDGIFPHQVTLLSFHAASLVQELFNGYILVYSPKRRASLSTLR